MIEKGRNCMKRTMKWTAVLIVFMGILLIAFGTAGAEGRLVTRLKPVPEELTQPRRGGAYIEKPQGYSTCVEYTYTVHNGTDTGVVSYEYFMAILDDPREGAKADVLYDSGIISMNEFTFTFYQTGEYILFVYRYDSNGEIINSDYGDNVQCRIKITEDQENNPLTLAVQSAASVCNKGNDFDTAVAINDYLVQNVEYDWDYYHYSPQAALLGSEYGFQHKTVCNGYSRAYQLIARACGLNCRKVNGKVGKENHAWDVVQINGKWYQVDPTWNDDENNPMLFQHIYMGLNDTAISVNHSGFDYPEGEVVCSTLEDNYFIHTGKWTDLAGDAETDAQTELDATSGNEETIIVDFGTAAWLEGGVYNVQDPEVLQINGHIVADALSRKTWARDNGGTQTAMRGTFTYDYSDGGSILTGQMVALAPVGGNCNDYISWSLDGFGTLTITGTGDLPSIYEMTDSWDELCNDIHAVVIGSGITGIGAGNFANCFNLTTVTIPSTVTRIDPEAFLDCENLTAVLSDNPNRTEITRCYDGDLRILSLPSTVEELGRCAFYGTPYGQTINLEPDFEIPINTGVIEAYAFYNISATHVRMETWQLSSCTIGNKAFGSCHSLRYFQVDSWGANINYTIADKAFDGCTQLTFIGTENEQLKQYALDHGFNYLENEAIWGNG